MGATHCQGEIVAMSVDTVTRDALAFNLRRWLIEHAEVDLDIYFIELCN